MTQPLDTQVTTRLSASSYDELKAASSRRARSISEEIRHRIESDCQCEGTGAIGLYRGEWIYCTCRLGIGYAMDDLSKQIQTFQAAIESMPKAISNIEMRELKQAHLDMLILQHDSLEAEWTRLGE